MLYNGNCSSFFKVEEGVRQGDPLSPYLFIIAISFLGASLLYDPNITGIKMNDSEHLLTQFADDLTLILEDSPCNLRNVLKLFDKFESCSGIRVNYDKSEIVWIGSKVGSHTQFRCLKPLKWLTIPTFEILGIEYDLRNENIIYQNYDKKLKSIRKLLNTWGWRYLTIFGKCTVIKSLAIPMLVHLLRSLPNPDDTFYRELESIIFDFLWNGKPDKIRRSVLINDIHLGGINLTHIESFSKSLKIFWVKKVLEDTFNSNWKTLLLDQLEKYGGNLFWHYHPTSQKILARNFNPFWKNIIDLWSDLNADHIVDEPCYLSRTIWHNPEIKIGGKTVFYRNYSEAGVNFINDLISEEGDFLSYPSFQRKYNFQTNLLKYNGIIRAIPREWKVTILEEGDKLEEVQNFWIKRISKIKKPNKIVYKIISEHFKQRNSKSEEKWALELDINKEDLTEFYLLHKKTLSCDSFLRAFQYKISNRILATNRLLFKIGISPYDLCTFCNTHSESIVHLYYDCNIIKNLWFQIFDDLDLRQKIPNLLFEKKIIIFGYNEENHFKKSFNLFLLYIKYYIYIKKLELTEPNLVGAKSYVRYKSKIHNDVETLNWDFIGDWV